MNSGSVPHVGALGSGQLPPVRRAGVEDAATLVSLRAVMFDAMRVSTGITDAVWRAEAEVWFGQWLARPALFAAFIAEDSALGAVSGACGICDGRPPGPRGISGARGQVFNVVTDPRCQRRGYARACVSALLLWFDQDTPAEAVELNATPDGVPLYTALGFRERGHPAMRLRLKSPTEALL